jgi:hypothetical protein
MFIKFFEEDGVEEDGVEEDGVRLPVRCSQVGTGCMLAVLFDPVGLALFDGW